MRFLITGATGMIGSKLVEQCHDLGIAVNYLTTSKNKITKTDHYKGFYWNPQNQEIDSACFHEVDAIVNLVGANVAERWTTKYKKEIIESRTKTAALMLNALKQIDHQVSYLVSASAIGIYKSSLTKLHTEDEDSEFYNNEYIGHVVQEWEAAVDGFSEIGIDVAKLRIGLVLAEKGGALERILQPINYYVGAPLGSGKQWQSWIHVNDLVSMFIYAVKHQLTGVFNAVAPNPVTNKELTKCIAEKVGKPLWLPNVPGFALKFALGEMSTIVLASQLVSSKKIQSEGFQFEYTYLKNTLEDLL
ncbi:TIGR01777 family oxidoreductase [Psychroflexus planctonicus]|uniref:NAD-dependent epimerase n=1 Tax=Psychroflexus planctonicus TaxID=1526575 RepID=A0ABQ1SFY3_9FLAO|nr:TIGR01777 family oxidoreductase [Psychroflexus planctonicus]GGE37021.1 NAD-dependent epimerase [Psychroflexus planctonicus]